MDGTARVLADEFEKRFGSTPYLFRAPGRVNLIGEHTDYNLGFVLPIAIDLVCYAAAAPNRDGTLRVFSFNLRHGREWPMASVPSLKPSRDWTDYVIGVIRQIPQANGLDVMVSSTVPAGSGLSSSAAIEVASALAAGWNLEKGSKLELAKLCRRAENEFVGVPTGIMDQYVAVFGEKGHAIQIDCRSLTHQSVSLPPGASIVAVNSMVKHELSAGAYRDRVAECQKACAFLGVPSLRDATLDAVERIPDPVVRKRARHVVSENLRVEAFVAASARSDLTEMGRLFVASHRSMQHDYEISCEELDYLVDTAVALPGVFGARMTGGGFGGCTVNLVKSGEVGSFEAVIRMEYQERFGIAPAFYRVEASQGASRIS